MDYDDKELDELRTKALKVVIRPELLEALGEDLEEVFEIIMGYVMDTIRITCTVYLRNKCRACIMVRIAEPFFEWLNEDGYKYLIESEDESPDQFMRQVIVFTKEWTEARMAEPCTQDSPSGLLH